MKKSRIGQAILILFLVCGVTFFAGGATRCTRTQAAGQFPNGVFEGTGRGYGGYLSVRVTVENGSIVDITLVEHQETPFFYSAAEHGVISAIISSQHTNVDTVSGATVTSRAIIEAVNMALGIN